MSAKTPTTPARTESTSVTSSRVGGKRHRDTSEGSDTETAPAKRQRTGIRGGNGDFACADEVPFEDLPDGATILTQNPETGKLLVAKKDHFTGALRKRTMMDDLYDRLEKEKPEKLRSIVDRQRLALLGRCQRNGKQETPASPSPVPSSLPSPPPSSSPPTSSPSSSSSSSSSSVLLSAPPAPSPPARVQQPPKGPSRSRHTAAGANRLVMEPGGTRPVPYTTDRVTGVFRRRRMMDDFLDSMSEEKRARYLDRARSQAQERAEESASGEEDASEKEEDVPVKTEDASSEQEDASSESSKEGDAALEKEDVFVKIECLSEDEASTALC